MSREFLFSRSVFQHTRSYLFNVFTPGDKQEHKEDNNTAYALESPIVLFHETDTMAGSLEDFAGSAQNLFSAFGSCFAV